MLEGRLAEGTSSTERRLTEITSATSSAATSASTATTTTASASSAASGTTLILSKHMNSEFENQHTLWNEKEATTSWGWCTCCHQPWRNQPSRLARVKRRMRTNIPVSHLMVKWTSLIAPKISSTLPILVLFSRYTGALKQGTYERKWATDKKRLYRQENTFVLVDLQRRSPSHSWMTVPRTRVNQESIKNSNVNRKGSKWTESWTAIHEIERRRGGECIRSTVSGGPSSKSRLPPLPKEPRPRPPLKPPRPPLFPPLPPLKLIVAIDLSWKRNKQ